MLLIGGVFILSLILIWKQSWPSWASRPFVGVSVITAALLLLSHEKLFELMSRRGELDPSVIRTTWAMFWNEAGGKESHADLGGGMAGALLFAASYQLFDSLGTKWICFLLFVVGFVVLTGKSLRETIGQIVVGAAALVRKEWLAFVADVKQWLAGRKRRASVERGRRSRRTAAYPAEESAEAGAAEADDELLSPPPIISDFAAVRAAAEPEEEKQLPVEDDDSEGGHPRRWRFPSMKMPITICRRLNFSVRQSRLGSRPTMRIFMPMRASWKKRSKALALKRK